MNHVKVEEVPGLCFFPQFFTPEMCDAMVASALSLYQQIAPFAESPESLRDAHIPQPDHVLDEEDGLSDTGQYCRVRVPDGERMIQSEVFPSYGGAGHVLAYFRGDQNLPAFIDTPLLSRVSQTMLAHGLMEAGRKRLWRLTANFYHQQDGEVAGFPFHVDLPANGVVTMILNIHNDARFQIVKGSELCEIQLPVGALLVLSGESRYDWKHRIMTKTAPSNASLDRVSLVLGYK